MKNKVLRAFRLSPATIDKLAELASHGEDGNRTAVIENLIDRAHASMGTKAQYKRPTFPNAKADSKRQLFEHARTTSRQVA